MMKIASGRLTALLISMIALVFVIGLTSCVPGAAQPQEEPAPSAAAPTEPAVENQEETQAAEPAQGGADPQKLMIPRWFLDSLTLDGQEVQVLPDQQGVTIQFEPGGKVNGTGGCNNFSASFQADYDGSMTFGPVISTKMFCEGSMALEDAYFQALSKVERFSTDDGLVLSSADGKTRIALRMPPK